MTAAIYCKKLQIYYLDSHEVFEPNPVKTKQRKKPLNEKERKTNTSLQLIIRGEDIILRSIITVI